MYKLTSNFDTNRRSIKEKNIVTWSFEKDFISAIYDLNLDLYITESGDVKKDIGHILDFITRVKCLKVGIRLPLNSFTVYWLSYFCS